MVEDSGVEASGVEASGVEASGVEASGVTVGVLSGVLSEGVLFPHPTARITIIIASINDTSFVIMFFIVLSFPKQLINEPSFLSEYFTTNQAKGQEAY